MDRSHHLLTLFPFTSTTTTTTPSVRPKKRSKTENARLYYKWRAANFKKHRLATIQEYQQYPKERTRNSDIAVLPDDFFFVEVAFPLNDQEGNSEITDEQSYHRSTVTIEVPDLMPHVSGFNTYSDCIHDDQYEPTIGQRLIRSGQNFGFAVVRSLRPGFFLRHRRRHCATDGADDNNKSKVSSGGQPTNFGVYLWLSGGVHH